jgi:hypothetical protein
MHFAGGSNSGEVFALLSTYLARYYLVASVGHPFIENVVRQTRERRFEHEFVRMLVDGAGTADLVDFIDRVLMAVLGASTEAPDRAQKHDSK